MFFDGEKKTGAITRFALADGKKTRTTSLPSAGFFLQPLNAEDGALYEGSFSRSMKMYTEFSVDIRESDQIVIDGEKYNVKSVTSYSFGLYPHKKILAERPID